MATRRDYLALAAALKGVKPLSPAPHAAAQWGLDVTAVAQVMSDNDPCFDKARFLKNAGVNTP